MEGVDLSLSTSGMYSVSPFPLSILGRFSTAIFFLSVQFDVLNSSQNFNAERNRSIKLTFPRESRQVGTTSTAKSFAILKSIGQMRFCSRRISGFGTFANILIYLQIENTSCNSKYWDLMKYANLVRILL